MNENETFENHNLFLKKNALNELKIHFLSNDQSIKNTLKKSFPSEHTKENSLTEDIWNPQGKFRRVDSGIPNTLPNCVFFLAIGSIQNII